jgi:hypothetical protein
MVILDILIGYYNAKYQMGGDIITQSTEEKDLGITIDEKLKFKIAPQLDKWALVFFSWIIKDKVLITVGCPIFPSILIAKYLFTGRPV